MFLLIQLVNYLSDDFAMALYQLMLLSKDKRIKTKHYPCLKKLKELDKEDR